MEFCYLTSRIIHALMKATLIVIAMAVRSTLAATYYVAPTGADTHPGTLAQPFRTIQKAADIVAPGDIVHVCPGIYAGLIGISCGQQNWPNIHHNVIHNMSSIGILTSEDGGKGPHNGEFHDNLVGTSKNPGLVDYAGRANVSDVEKRSKSTSYQSDRRIVRTSGPRREARAVSNAPG